MGANSSSATQSTVSLSSLLKRYQVVHKDEHLITTIVKQKQSQTLFIIKELAFVQKAFYQRHLCRFNHFQQREQCQNTLNLTKVWTQEHTTLCSNTYKIFPMYEYSNVTLRDQMEARRSENKHFEEDQLLGIIQSCVNALNSQPPILISPSEYFICQDGLLKLNNHDLFDAEVLQTYTKNVYYSFEKMENFDQTVFYQNDENYLKQAVFSLGVTLLSCIYLQDVGEKVYFPLHQNRKMRLNGNALENLIRAINQINTKQLSQPLINLIRSMMNHDPKTRPSLYQIQDQLDQIVKLRHSRIEIDQISEKQELEIEIKMANINLKHRNNKENNHPIFNRQNLSTIEDKNGNNLRTFKSKQLSDSSDLDVLRQFSTGNRLNNHSVSHHFEIPLVLSKNVQNQRREPIVCNQNSSNVQQILPSPISKQNPLFTNPQFLAKINDDIKQFSFKRKNSFASTQFSRKNSNLILLTDHQNGINNLVNPSY